MDKRINKLFETYKNLDFFIFPSMKGEGLNFVILEAISWGLIVIAKKYDYLEEISIMALMVF